MPSVEEGASRQPQVLSSYAKRAVEIMRDGEFT
jgi:hypothetical protein